jgi:FtsP/CotA-like multicopper oxidase with cupredoxin domain
VPLSPGERAEVVAEFQPGERVVLRSFPPELGMDPFQGRFAGGDDTFDLLQVRAAAALTPSPAVPDRLAHHQRLSEADAVRTRTFELDDGGAINGRPMDLGRIDQAVTVGTAEVWEVANRSGNVHNFHLHGVQFKLSTTRAPGGRRRSTAGRTPCSSHLAAPFGCWSGSPTTPTRPCPTCSTATCCSTRTTG